MTKIFIRETNEVILFTEKEIDIRDTNRKKSIRIKGSLNKKSLDKIT